MRVLPFLLPVFTKDGLLPRRLARLLGTTMWMYDLTGGLRIGKLHKRVSKEEALRYMPTLPADNIAASYIYYDAQADDARLTLTVAKTAADVRRSDRQLRDARRSSKGPGRQGQRRARRASTVTRSRSGLARSSTRRACGPTTSARSTRARTPRPIRPAKGMHITVPWSMVRNEIAAVIPVPKDRRSVFVVPWGGEGGPHRFTYIGTTDTDYDGPVDDPQITPDDVEYLLRAINSASRPRSPKPTSSAPGPGSARS